MPLNLKLPVGRYVLTSRDRNAPRDPNSRLYAFGHLELRPRGAPPGDHTPAPRTAPPTLALNIDPSLHAPIDVDTMATVAERNAIVDMTRKRNEVRAHQNAARQAQERVQAQRFVEARATGERLLAEVGQQLAQMGAPFFWTSSQRSRAVDHLSRLLAGRADMVATTREKADTVLRRHLVLMLDSLDGVARTAHKNALTAFALGELANRDVPFADKGQLVHLLMVKRERLRDQLRRPDEGGRAPALLREQAVPLLRVYREELGRLQAANLQPRLPEWDNLLLPLLLEAQNARTEGLDAKLLAHDQLVRHVKKNRKKESSSIGIFDFDPLGPHGSGHHCAFHISTSSSRPPHITFVESMRLDVQDPSEALNPAELNELPKGSRIVPVNLGVLNAMDCVIYSLSTAKKIADHGDLVNDLWKKSGVARESLGVRIHHPIDGTRELPLLFFKHSQSKGTLDMLAQVGQATGRHDAHNDQVNKVNKPEPGQTLFQKWDAHRVDRPKPDNPQEISTYSASIEPKRRLLVDQAIDHYLQPT